MRLQLIGSFYADFLFLSFSRSPIYISNQDYVFLACRPRFHIKTWSNAQYNVDIPARVSIWSAMNMPSNLSSADFILIVIGAWLIYKFSQAVRMRTKMTNLRGPPASSWLLGVSKDVFLGDSGALYEKWAEEFGPVYQIPGPFGSRRTILTDAKAIAHFYSKETFVYVNSAFAKQVLSNLIGKGLLWAEGESHRRQRKALTPAFSNVAIRNLTPIFYDSAYKVKTAWDAVISSSDDAVIDVQKWMNCVSLDSIGIAGFGHDFGALEGRHSDVENMFDSFGTLPPLGISIIIPLLGQVLPFLMKIPTSRTRLVRKLHHSMEEIAEVLLTRSRKEKEAGESGGNESDRSIIGALIKAENADPELRLTGDEVLAQMKVFLLAGYETTSISLTWALIELSLHPEKQDRLRTELADFAAKDPSYEQITNGLPYLDAVMREILRLHPPVAQTSRIAADDDVIPLSAPMKTSSGQTIDRISISRGAGVLVPIRGVNCSKAIWGPDAKDFKPERWLDGDAGLTTKAMELQGYHHLLTFIDGPRTCLGRAFAIAEFKSVLSVLVRNYVFAMRDGLETKVEKINTILPRPKVSGEEGYAMPMRVRRFEY
ncbi:cytochrome P450 [Phellopilus nigrolimitatus]|nr:cytochrome P450 [Phellopilus nigrolimitatus]